MVTPEQVRAKAKEVVEAANDLRFLEVTGLLIGDPRFTAEDVAGQGDTGVGRYDDYAPTMIGDRIKLAQSGQSAQLGTEFDWIVGYFENYTRITETPYQDMFNALDAVLPALAKADNHVHNIMQFFDPTDWAGEFSTNLQVNLFTPMFEVPCNQANVVRELQAAVQGHWNLVMAVRHSILAIGEKTRATLQARIGAQAADPNDAVMPIIGAVLAIAGAIITFVPSAGASVAVIPAVLAAAGAAKAGIEAGVALKKELEDGDSREVSIDGGTASEIIQSMIIQIMYLDSLINDEETKLDTKLVYLVGQIEAKLQDTTGDKDMGTPPPAWCWQAYRSELADGLPKSDAEMNNPK